MTQQMRVEVPRVSEMAPAEPAPRDEEGPTGGGSRRRHSAWLWLGPALLLLVVVEFIPFIVALTYSFRGLSFTDPNLDGQFVGLENYRRAVHDSEFLDSIIVTFRYMVPAVVLQVGLGLGLALLLAQQIRGRRFLVPILVLPTMIAPVVVGLIGVLSFNTEFGFLGIYLQRLGLLDASPLGSESLALWTIVGVDTWQWTPFVALILLAGLLSLPRQPYEAAQMDGASAWQTFRLVTLPLLKPYLIVVVLIRAIDAFRIFDIIWMMTRGGPGTVTETVSVYAYRLNFRFWHLGYGAAVVMLIFLISFLGSFLLYKMLARQKVGVAE
jgi:multiple sugar transport system permease protein